MLRPLMVDPPVPASFYAKQQEMRLYYSPTTRSLATRLRRAYESSYLFYVLYLFVGIILFFTILFFVFNSILQSIESTDNKISYDYLRDWKKGPFPIHYATNDAIENLHKVPVSMKDSIGFITKSQMNCSRIFGGDKDYITYKTQNRVTIWDDSDDMECSAIYSRMRIAQVKVTQEERDFPIAYIRVIDQEYKQLEYQLMTTYSPQNRYCLHIDAKADQMYKSRVYALSSCFPNIFVTSQSYIVESSGENMLQASLLCMKELLAHPNWKYVLLAQNHDINLRTNLETVRYLKFLNGTNDVDLRTVKPFRSRIQYIDDWTYKRLALVPKSLMLRYNISENQEIPLAKGYVIGAYTREFVQFIFDESQVFVWNFLDQLSRAKYGMDEYFFSTLNMLPYAPGGGYTNVCFDQMPDRDTSTYRVALWRPYNYCRSGFFRHTVCILGIEDVTEALSWPTLVANKMLQSFDFGGIHCIAEALYERSQNGEVKLNMNDFSNLPQRVYMKNRDNINFNASTDIDCSVRPPGWPLEKNQTSKDTCTSYLPFALFLLLRILLE